MRRFWKVTELRELRALYSHMSNRDLGGRFGRSPGAIKQTARKLGLRKSPEHMAAYCRWQKGHATWNKGVHWNPPGSRVTWFRQGQRGVRQKPVGTERIERDGVMVKVAEPNTWKPKARLVWERHYGPIPTGAIVRLRDGDKHNCSPENLMLITRAENARLNYRPRRPKPTPAWIVPVDAYLEAA